MPLWSDPFPATVRKGPWGVATGRDASEIEHFARLTEGHERIDGAAIAKLEPELAGRFARGLLFRQEGHLDPHAAMLFLLDEVKRAGAEVLLGTGWPEGAGGS